MKLKLDENIGRRGIDLLTTSGHDVATVLGQGLGGSTDEKLFTVCASEGRALVTLDRDFGQVLRFPPAQGAGIVVIEIGPQVSTENLLSRLREFTQLLETQALIGKLWIIEPGRVRIHLGDGE
jgi:predicted nuclease of predicted toxin-antitoxin system